MELDTDDRLRIGDVIARAQVHMDRNEPDAFADLFEDDAELLVPGREALATRDDLRHLVSSSPRGVHLTGAPVVSAGATAVTALVTQTFLFRNAGTGSFLGGWYEDQLVKRDGRWRISERVIRFFETASMEPRHEHS